MFALAHIWGHMAGPASKAWITHFVGLQGYTLTLLGVKQWYTLLSPIAMGTMFLFAPLEQRQFCIMAWDIIAALYAIWRATKTDHRGQEVIIMYQLMIAIDTVMPFALGCYGTVAALATIHLLMSCRMCYPVVTGIGPPPYLHRDIRDLSRFEFGRFLEYVRGTTAEFRYETIHGTNLVSLYETLQRWKRGADNEHIVKQNVIDEHLLDGAPYFVPLGIDIRLASKEYITRETLRALQIGWGENFFENKELQRSVPSDNTTTESESGVSLESYY